MKEKFLKYIGQKIYYLSDYNWSSGELLKVNKKNLQIDTTNMFGTSGGIKNIPIEKCATPEELVCVVWERWKGVNGRGGYRVERTLYNSFRVPANKVYYQAYNYDPGSGRVSESVLGTIDWFDNKTQQQLSFSENLSPTP